MPSVRLGVLAGRIRAGWLRFKSGQRQMPANVLGCLPREYAGKFALRRDDGARASGPCRDRQPSNAAV